MYVNFWQELQLEKPLVSMFLYYMGHISVCVWRYDNEKKDAAAAAAAAAKLLQSCPTLCDPIGGSPPGFPVHGIVQTSTGVGCHCLLQKEMGAIILFLRIFPLVFGLYIYTQAYLKLAKEISLSSWSNDSQIFAYFRIVRELLKKQNDVSPSPSWISDLVGWITFPISFQMILMLLLGNYAPYTLF